MKWVIALTACLLGAWAGRAGAASIVTAAAGAEAYDATRTCFVKILAADEHVGSRARFYSGGLLVRDVPGLREMAWVDSVLVFTVSPATGDPGVYAWDCVAGTLRRIVKPERSSLQYPRGTDVFRLVDVEDDVLYYAHAPDVDSPGLERELARDIETLRLKPPATQLGLR